MVNHKSISTYYVTLNINTTAHECVLPIRQRVSRRRRVEGGGGAVWDSTPETRHHSRTSRVNSSVFVFENTRHPLQSHIRHENASARTRENPTRTHTRTSCRIGGYGPTDTGGETGWHVRAAVSLKLVRARPQTATTTTTRALLGDATVSAAMGEVNGFAGVLAVQQAACG